MFGGMPIDNLAQASSASQTYSCHDRFEEVRFLDLV